MEAILALIMFILYAAIVVLIVYLILLAAKLRDLADDLRRLMRDQVIPTLSESRETISKLNDAGTQVKKTVNSISHAVGAVEGHMADINPPAMGRKLGFQVAKKAVIWLAGLTRATEAVRSERKERNEETSGCSE